MVAGMRDVPRDALRLTGGEVELAGAQNSKRQGGKEPAAVRLLARSPEAIDHWYWGRIVHDLSGMVLSKSRVPVDWMHDPDSVIGYADKFGIEAEGLVCSGMLVPIGEDRAAEIVYKAGAGVPYESSINFGGTGIKLEEVAPGEVVEVNGAEFVGPGVVVREWPLRGIAICPYGADQNTAAEFSSDDTGDGSATVAVEMVERGTIQRGDGAGLVRFASPITPPLAGAKVVAPDRPAEGRNGAIVRFESNGLRLFASGSKRPPDGQSVSVGGEGGGPKLAGLVRIRK